MIEFNNLKIIEYEEKYAQEVKDLLVELQEHIVNIDVEKYNIITPQYRETYFTKTLDEVKKYCLKTFLKKKSIKRKSIIEIKYFEILRR